jgi:hypothetical protein
MTGEHWIYRPQSHKTQAKTGDTFIAIPALQMRIAILTGNMPKNYSEQMVPALFKLAAACDKTGMRLK